MVRRWSAAVVGIRGREDGRPLLISSSPTELRWWPKDRVASRCNGTRVNELCSDPILARRMGEAGASASKSIRLATIARQTRSFKQMGGPKA